MQITATQPTRGYQPSPSDAQFSVQGRLLADHITDSYDKAEGDWQAVRQIAAQGLAKIRDTAQCTTDEQEIAALGLDIGSGYMVNKMAAEMQRTVLDTLAAAVPGPVGQVLAQVSLQALPLAADDQKVARSVVQDGLEAVLTSSKTSRSEKEVAALGLGFGDGYQYSDEAAGVQGTVLRTIAADTSGLMPQVLARATLDAVNGTTFREQKTVRSLETQGLRAVLNHAEATAYDKTVAGLGLNFSDDHMYNDDAAKVQQAVLKALTTPGKGNLPFEIARVTQQAYYTGIRFETGRKILREGFSAILESPTASPAQMSLAQAGIEAGAADMSDQNACQRRLEICRQLLALG